MKKEQLKERAKSLCDVPDRFQPVIEEFFEREDGKGEAVFTWADKQQEEGISITLDLSGNLTSLSIEREQMSTDTVNVNEGELRERAEAFLSSHYPHILQKLALFETKKLADAYRFYFEQLVMNLPLPQAGCYIDVDFGGEIVNFKYYGLQPEPEIPKAIIEKGKLLKDVRKRLDCQLAINNLHTELFDVEENGLHLLYDVDLFMNYKAGAVEPTLTIIHEEDVPEKHVSLPALNTVEHKEYSIDEIIGITEEMEVIRQVDLGKEMGFVWRDRNWEERENNLSINSFFENRNEGTVKAFISKKSENVRGFLWFKERNGDLALDREECYQKAIDFLQMITPYSAQYLQLIVHDEDDELNDTRMKESFSFQVHNGQGIRVSSELLIVAVYRHTGHIDYYSGPSFDFEELGAIPSEPVISKEEAHAIFLENVDFRLEWKKNTEENEDSYTLAYRACERTTGKAIRYIDALTGAVITAKL